MALAGEFTRESCKILIFDDCVEKDGARVEELLRAAATVYIEDRREGAEA